MGVYECALGFMSCGLLFLGKQFPLSWRRAPALCSGSVGSTASPSASAVLRPVTGCTPGTDAPGGPVYVTQAGMFYKK